MKITVCPVCNLMASTSEASKVGQCFIGKDLISCVTGGGAKECSPEDAAPVGWQYIGQDALGEYNYERVNRQESFEKTKEDSTQYQLDQLEEIETTNLLINEFASYNRQRLDLSSIYPETLASKLKGAALSLPIAPECVHQVFLAIAASLIGTKAKLKISQTWSEPAILWTGFVSLPGTRKSPCMAIARKPLVKLQGEAWDEWKEEQSDYEKKVRAWENMSKAEKKAAAFWETPVKPNLRNYYVEDATVDSIVEVHCQEESKNGFAMVFDELSELFDGLDQYKGGKGNDRKKVLRFWSGGDLKVNRKSADTLLVKQSAVSVTGGIQPSVLGQLMGNGDDDDGMWGRFLWVSAPAITAESREIHESIEPFLYGIYTALDGLKVQDYTFTPEAYKLFSRVEIALERMMSKSPTAIKQVLAKLVGYAGRLALVLHCLDIALGLIPESVTIIPESTMQRVVTLLDFYHRQVKVLYSKSAKSDLPTELMRIVELSQQTGYVTVRDIQRKGWTKTNAEAQKLLEELVSLGIGELSKTVKNSYQWRYMETIVSVETLITELAHIP